MSQAAVLVKYLLILFSPTCALWAVCVLVGAHGSIASDAASAAVFVAHVVHASTPAPVGVVSTGRQCSFGHRSLLPLDLHVVTHVPSPFRIVF